MNRRTRVYVAGPLSTGDDYGQITSNIKSAMTIGDALFTAGYAPYVPHYSHYWQLLFPHSWEEWMELDKAYVLSSDCILRIVGSSKGVDEEVRVARANRIPIYFSVLELMQNMPRTQVYS